MNYIAKLRWPKGFCCPNCGDTTEKPSLTGRGLFLCRKCKRQTSITSGTLFHKTHKPLRTWFFAMWFVTSQKHGASALGLKRVLGLGSYNTAWTWLHKLRRAMVRSGRDQLTGAIEVDETYVGGVGAKVRGRGAKRKTIVAIAAEVRGRGPGRIRMSVIPDVSAISLHEFVSNNVERGYPFRSRKRIVGSSATLLTTILLAALTIRGPYRNLMNGFQPKMHAQHICSNCVGPMVLSARLARLPKAG